MKKPLEHETKEIFLKEKMPQKIKIHHCQKHAKEIHMKNQSFEIHRQNLFKKKSHKNSKIAII